MPDLPCILFCANPLTGRGPDPDFAAEHDAARDAGFTTALLDLEALVDDDAPARAVRRVPPDIGPILYRGWMLTAATYARLCTALDARGASPMTSPGAYRLTHHLGEGLHHIAAHSPDTVTLPVDFSREQLADALARLGPQPVIVKDQVKSRKHEWLEACFVPDASDLERAARVVETFVERQGSSLTPPVVLRAFEPFEPLGPHPRSGMPMTREVRVFVVERAPLLVAGHWGQPLDDDTCAAELFGEVWRAIESPFFTADLARRTDGTWRIVELGDGQVAGLPDGLDPARFYTALAERLHT